MGTAAAAAMSCPATRMTPTTTWGGEVAAVARPVPQALLDHQKETKKDMVRTVLMATRVTPDQSLDIKTDRKNQGNIMENTQTMKIPSTMSTTASSTFQGRLRQKKLLRPTRNSQEFIILTSTL